MSTTKQKPIKAALHLRRMGPKDVVAASVTIQTKMFNNSHLTGAPAPPVDQATLKTQTDLLSAKIAAAAGGDKSAIAEKNHQKEVVINLLEQLAHYVEANCKNDMTTFVSTGFTPKASTKQKTPPASESIRKVEPGPNSGEMTIVLMPFLDAVSYVLQYALLGAGGVPGPWTIRPVAKLRPPVLLTGLTPGATYVFQARALTKTGYSDWGESITRIAV